jgi:Na+/H+ antiporter NhaC
MTSWVLGIVVFIDDYLNILTVSTSMMETCDQQKTPREMLAYVIDSTGAPVCVLIPLSSWAVFYAAVLQDTMGVDSGYGTGMEMYIQSVPFILYGWTAVIVVPLVVLGIIPKIGGMKKAYKRVADGGNVYSEASASLNEGLNIELQEVEMTEEERSGDISFKNIACFFIPLLTIIAITVVTMDLIIALAWSIVVMLVLYVPLKIVKFIEFWESFAKGIAFMVPMNLIIIGALTVKTSMDGIGLPDYVIQSVLPFMNIYTFPAVTFVVVAGLSFITGSNWGIPALTVPILIPLALIAGAHPLIVFGAIVSGGTFGSHACFYSDATVLTSQSCRIKNLEHAFTQFPYALISAGLAVIGFLILGFTLQ